MKSFIFALCIMGVSPLFSQCWNLVWADEFNGTALDATKWTPQTGGGGWGNGELENYTARPENIDVSAGTLKIIAKSEVYGGNNYTSARLRTIQKGDWTYGKFEARMKLSTAQVMWPAFWMMPTDEVYGTWPNSGEIDIMELIGTYPSRSYGTIHTSSGTAGVSTSSGANYNLPSGTFGDAFHNFSVEWSPNEIKWLIDGVVFATKTPADFGSSPWRFDKDFHIILNLAVGGSWPGSPNGSTIFPQTTEIEYVRVYQKNSDFAVRGLATVAPTATTNYKVPNVASTTYNWTVPSGATIVSGQGTAEISVTWGAVSGNVTCAISTPCGATTVAEAVNVTANLLQNWSFETNLNNWNMAATNGAVATFASPTDAAAPNGTRIACINTTAVTGTSWHVQMSQSGLNVVAGQSYTCKLKAKSSAANKRLSAAVINSSTYAQYGYQQFNLTTTWQDFAFTFTASTTAAVSFNIDCGFDVAEFCLDNIIFGKTSLLPVELVDFNLINSKNGVQLNWKTANEINLLKYQIERSIDGVLFEKIGEISAKNLMNYSFLDTDLPTNFNTFYYRLKSINADYTEGSSKILTYRRSNVLGAIKVYPNPIFDELYVETSEKVQFIEAIDASGRVFNIPFSLSPNGVLGVVSQLSAGIFQIKITLTNSVSQQFSIVKK
jgi:beta-glucanase (GH16 family)